MSVRHVFQLALVAVTHMTEKAPILPLGYQDFTELRLRNLIYVDKTEYFPRLFNISKAVVLSRPRRFGKTLTLNTLDAYFSGEKALFQGLAAEKYISAPDYVPYPVINLDMGRGAGTYDLGDLERGIIRSLDFNAKRYDLSLKSSYPVDAFDYLIYDIYVASGKTKVVLLIDEYDAPIIRLLQRTGLQFKDDLFNQTRTLMESFYTQIKISDKYLQFVYITGVTKFSKMGVFS
jgi:hypothetical protein